MIVPPLIIIHGALLDAFRRHFQCNVDDPVFAALRSQHPQLDRVQRISGVSAGQIRQELQCIVVDRGMETPHPFVRVINRSPEQGLDILFFQRF